MRLLYGTGNEGKLASARRSLAGMGVELLGLRDMRLPIPEVEEAGATPLANARLKAAAYYSAFRLPVFSCDSGLYFDGVSAGEQPGLHVRTVGGKRLSDGEMIRHYAALAGRHGGSLTARYRNALCFFKGPGEVYECEDDSLSGRPFLLVDTPHERRVPGFPLDSLSVQMESGCYYLDRDQDAAEGLALDEGLRAFFRKYL